MDWLWQFTVRDCHSSSQQKQYSGLRPEAPEFVSQSQSLESEENSLTSLTVKNMEAFQPSIQPEEELVEKEPSELEEQRAKQIIPPPKRLTYNTLCEGSKELIFTTQRIHGAFTLPATNLVGGDSNSPPDKSIWAFPISMAYGQGNLAPSSKWWEVALSNSYVNENDLNGNVDGVGAIARC